MKLLEFNTISNEGVASLQQSFNNLPETSHKDGKYRLRRYSAIELRTTFWNAKKEIEITSLPTRDFVQSGELNKFQGDMTRSFEEIEEHTLQSSGMKEACLIFKERNNLNDGQEVEVHQIRVITLHEETLVAPEGVHQDGYDHIAMMGINRHNVNGGELLVYDSSERSGRRNAEPFICYELGNGDMAMLADKKLWHNATPLVSSGEDGQGYMDLFVFCAKD